MIAQWILGNVAKYIDIKHVPPHTKLMCDSTPEELCGNTITNALLTAAAFRPGCAAA